MKNVLKIFIAITMFSVNTFADAPTTAEPVKPVCQLTHDVTNGDGNVTTQPNPACQREWSVYNAVKSEYDKAKANGQQTNYAGLAEPTKPANRNCSGLAGGGEPGMTSQQQACMLDEQRDLKAYNDQKLRYDLQQQELERSAAVKADAEAKRLSSASEGYNDLSEKNKKGSVIYQVASVAAGVAGAYYIKQAMACSVHNPTCSSINYTKAAVAFGIMGIAMSQSGRMDNAGYQACQASNQTSSTQVACGTAPGDPGNVYDPSNPKNPLSNLGPDGKCLPSAPPDCNDKIRDAADRAGLKIADIKGVNGFAGDKLKIARDGTVTFPDGKKMNLADLMTAEGMQSAGLSASESAALMKQFGINGGTVANLDAEKALKELNHAKPIDGFGDGGGSSSIQTSASILNGAATNKNEKRKPAAEGLTRDFNGERIGAAGDDIFGMMNRRYQLKTSQDTFIGQ